MFRSSLLLGSLVLLTALLAPPALPQELLESFYGGGKGGNAGSSVALIYNLTGDGRAEVIVGIPNDSSVAFEAGSVQILNGATGAVYRTHYGAAAGDHFGHGVDILGDVNGDGKNDYVVGIPFWDSPGGSINIGRVVVYSGATGVQLSAFAGGNTGDGYGACVRYLGECAKISSGHTSLIGVGAPWTGVNHVGTVYLRAWNGSVPQNLGTTLFDGTNDEGHFGLSIAGPLKSGDTARFAAAAPHATVPYFDSGLIRGVVKLFTKLPSQDWSIVTSSPSLVPAESELGSGLAFATLGSLGSSVDSYLLGAPGSNQVLAISASAPHTLVGTWTGTGRFGSSIGSLGPPSLFSTEGKFLVGAPDEAVLGTSFEVGKVLVFGSASHPLKTLTGVNPEGHFGAAIAPRGLELTGDLLPDIAAGAPAQELVGADQGAVRVFSGVAPWGLAWNANGPMQGSNAGRSVLACSDWDGNGTPDFLVGAPWEYFASLGVFDHSAPMAGRVFLLDGATGAVLQETSDVEQDFGDEFGWSLAPVGDMDADGVDEFAVGSPQRSNPNDSRGRATLRSGKFHSAKYVRTGPSNGAEFGYAVAGIGDRNLDGIPDYASGAPGTTNGAVYFYSGPTGSLLGTVNGEAAGDRFGHALAGLGDDVTGDGRPDYLVGAPQADVLASVNASKAYLLTSHTSFQA